MNGILTGKTIKQVSTKHQHTVVLASDNRVYAYGNNQLGMLGNGLNIVSLVPVAVLLDKTVTQIAAGFYHTVVLTNDNMAYGWGYNGFGNIGKLYIIIIY
jgi:alpha-tubulin suppressor-like RCC1 family protein